MKLPFRIRPHHVWKAIAVGAAYAAGEYDGWAPALEALLG